MAVLSRRRRSRREQQDEKEAGQRPLACDPAFVTRRVRGRPLEWPSADHHQARKPITSLCSEGPSPRRRRKSAVPSNARSQTKPI